MTASPFTPAVTFTPEQIEGHRIEQLAEAASERETTPEGLAADFAPGTFGCHEALQVASILGDSVDRHLCEHPAILVNADWYRLASEAQTALFNLYQAIGAEHLGGDGGEGDQAE